MIFENDFYFNVRKCLNLNIGIKDDTCRNY